MMNLVGNTDDELPEFASVQFVAELMNVHPNSVRQWIKKNWLQATQVGRVMKISRASLSRFLHQRRMEMAHEAPLSAQELQSATPAIADLLGAPIADVATSLEALEAHHHVTPIQDSATGSVRLWVHPGTDPKQLVARTVKWMLIDEPHHRNCVGCGEKLPRMLQPAGRPRPKHVWKLYGRVPVQGHPGLRLAGWSHWCSNCDQDAKFLHVDRSPVKPQPLDVSSVVLRTQRAEALDTVTASAGDLYLDITNDERQRLLEADVGEAVEFAATVMMAPSNGLVQRRYPWLEVGTFWFRNARIVQPDGHEDYAEISNGMEISVSATRE